MFNIRSTRRCLGVPFLLSLCLFNIVFHKCSRFASGSAGHPGLRHTLQMHLALNGCRLFPDLPLGQGLESFPPRSWRFSLPPGPVAGLKAAGCHLEGQGEMHSGQLACSFPVSPRDSSSVFAVKGNKSLLDIGPPSLLRSASTAGCNVTVGRSKPASGRRRTHGASRAGAWTGLSSSLRGERNFKDMSAKETAGQKESCCSHFNLQNSLRNPMFGEPLMAKHTRAEGD